MSFLDEFDSARDKVPGRRIGRPALAGIACVAVVVVALAAMGIASTAKGDFIVGLDASSPSAATNGEEGVPADAAADGQGDGAEPSGSAYVYVVGAVEEPGVYELSPDARVNDAIEAAGGFAKMADRAAVNLARPIVDGEQIVIPREGERAEAAAGGAAQPAVPDAVAGDASSGIAPDGKVNLNTATAAQLQSLPGVGEATASKIVASRESEGPFASPEDLKRVSGIGEKKYAALADLVTV